MQDVEREDLFLSTKLTLLIEQNKSLQRRLKELAVQKAELVAEINNLRHLAISRRIKLEFIVYQSSGDLGDDIRQKRSMLADATNKLDTTLMEETHLAARIQSFENKKRDNTQTLVQMRADYSSLQEKSASEEASVIGIRLKTLVTEQSTRIERFFSLKKRIAEIKLGDIMDDIEREKGLWFNALKKVGGK